MLLEKVSCLISFVLSSQKLSIYALHPLTMMNDALIYVDIDQGIH